MAMKRCFFILFFLSTWVYGQTEEKVYFYFDTKSDKTWLPSGDDPPPLEKLEEYKRKYTIGVYRKYNEDNGEIDFYIYDLLFVHKKKMERVIKPIDFLEKHKLLSAEEVKVFMEEITNSKKNGGYLVFQYGLRENEYPIYIVEKKDNRHVVLYRVEWEHYEV